MKSVIMLLLAGMGFALPEWQTNFETAKKLAREKNRYILLNFSGSDWCAPCIRLRKEVFESEAFSKVADSSLILLNADFPRSKKNQLAKSRQQHNEALADRYNPAGKFPFTLLLDADGKIIRSWEGFPNNNASQFLDQLKSTCHASNYP